jgi:hypothetical protein
MAVGVAVALIGFGVITVKTKSGNAPPMVLASVGGIFALAGFGLIWSGIKSIFEHKRISAAKALRGNTPWDYDYAWNPSGCLIEKGKQAVGSLWAFLFLGLFMVPFNWWAFYSNKANWVVYLVVGIFDLILIAILFHGIYTLLQAAKYGNPFLRFEKFPYFTGEKMTVFFEPSKPLGDFRAVEITLRCIVVRQVRVQTGKGSRMENRCIQIYADELKIDQAGSMGTEALPLSFDIPINVPGTSLLDDKIRFWELEIKADTPGVDFSAEFPLPIYHKRG